MPGCPKGVPADHLVAVGLDPAEVLSVEVVSSRHGHQVIRVRVQGQSHILKIFPRDASSEVAAYHLLANLSVPTPGLHGWSDRSLLLDDLAASLDWRMAEEDDLARAEAGEAVARWYRRLHRAGVSVAQDPPAFLRRESDVLTGNSIMALAETLGLPGHTGLELAADCIEVLKDALASVPQTLNHNDFYWKNLALSRQGPRRALVYDYHLMGLGPACSDCRNVLSVLTGDAAAAFREIYGSLPGVHFILDRPVATLHALYHACRQPNLPAWAMASMRQVESGEFEDDLRAALAVARGREWAGDSAFIP